MRSLIHDASVLRLIHIALAEDIGDGDITSEAILEPSVYARATLVANADGIVCGLPVAALVFRTHDPDTRVEELVEEGTLVTRGTQIAHVYGYTRRSKNEKKSG